MFFVLRLLLFSMGFSTSLMSIRVIPSGQTTAGYFTLGKSYFAATIVASLSFFSGLVCVSWVL